jgi:CHAD domain-containing protein
MAPVDLRETEWQFDAVDLATVARALESNLLDSVDVRVSDDGAVTHTDLYLDTEDQRLHRAGYALRIRRVGRRRAAEATLKSLTSSGSRPGPLARREITQELESADLDALIGTDGPVAERARAVAGRKPLRPLFTIRTRRRSFSLASQSDGGGVLSLDASTIAPASGSGTTRLLRVEVEIDGRQEEAFAPFVERLRSECGLQAAKLSKYEAALLVSDLRPAEADSFGSTAIDPHSSTVGDAGLAVVRRHFSALLAREPGTRLGEDTEELHDMRVASRRLRAALSLFAEVLPPSVTRAEDDLRWIGHALGDVRDLDVQLEQLAEWLEVSAEADRAALEPLRELLEGERASARVRMLVALDSRRYELFADRFARALRSRRPRRVGPWSRPVLAAAPDLIESRFRAVRTAGERIRPAAEPADYHRLRIRAKRLRYALEFFADAYPGETSSLVRRLVALQDTLGRHQDAQVAILRLRTLASDEKRPLDKATVFAMGEVAERYRQDMAALREKVPGVFAKVIGKNWRTFHKVMQKARPVDHPVGMTAAGTDAGSIKRGDG